MADIDLTALLNDPRAELGALPVGENRSGVDMREDAEFEALDAEFRKMETGGPAAVDWKMLNGRTLKVIETKSKDLVLASRLTYGLFREEGYKGLAVGASILKGMVADHWEGLFPSLKRERGRAGTIDWLAERLAGPVEQQQPVDGARTFALVAHDRLAELDELLSAKMQKFPVALGPLLRALRPHARDARAAIEAREAEAKARAEAEKAAAEAAANGPAPDPVAAPQPPAAAATPQPATPPPPAAAPPAAAAVAVDIPTDQGTDKALLATLNAAGRIATALRQEAPSDARGYLCARFAYWSRVVVLPPNNAGKTNLPPPQKVRLNELQSLQAAGNPDRLLQVAEAAFVATPFWLDAQLLVAGAMQALGPEYDASRSTVVGQLGAFLSRLPGLASLTFSDGMPFADADTIAWIGKEVSAGSGGDGAGGSELDRKKAAAGKLGQSGQMLPGLAILSEFAESRFGERERFLAQLEIGEYCLRFELLQPLIPMLGNLTETVERRALGAWEPQLAAQLASLSWRALSHKNAKRYIDEREAAEKRVRAMAMLAELDMMTAARLSTSQVG